MDDRTLARRLSIVAYVGLGLVIAGFIGHAFSPALLTLSLVGLLLVAIGGFGLIASARRAMLRPVQPLPPAGGPAGAYAPHPPPNVPLPPPPPMADLGSPTRFDLTGEFAEYKRRMRTAIWMRVAMGVFLAGIGVFSVVSGVVRGNPASIVAGIAILGLSGFLFWVLRSVNRAPVEVVVGPGAIQFRLEPPENVVLRWDDPQFGIKITIISAAVNRSLYPGRTRSTYRLFTGSGSGVGHGPRVLTKIPRECFDLVLRHAEAHGVYPLEVRRGVPGTVSEYVELRLVQGARPFTAGTPYLPPAG